MDWKGGEVLICGSTDFAQVGRGGGGKSKKSEAELREEALRAEQYPSLVSVHRVKGLTGVRVLWIASGSAACHSLLGDDSGNCYSWGRNEKGQLGHGDLVVRSGPVVISALSTLRVTAGACGKHHSAVVTDSGASYTFGSNLQGQCGTGSVKSSGKSEELIMQPVKALIEDCTSVACGAEFTMWLCAGKLFSAGMPQYGHLGDGTDHEYNASATSVNIKYEPQPTPSLIASLTGTNITQVACGHNHTLAVDEQGSAYTWGFGGYGRLGHSVQQDEHAPRSIQTFRGRMTVSAKDPIACGQTASFAIINGGQLFAWGKLKTSGDSQMYPKPFTDLAGWTIRDISCGAATYAVAAHYQDEQSTITWGHGPNGELGYGPQGKKSSAKPDKLNDLEGVYTHKVACGVAHTLFLVDANDEAVRKLPIWEPSSLKEPPAASAAGDAKLKGGGKATGKRKAEGAKTGAKNRRK